MDQSLKHADSSTESSEDEEEALKIREALCDESIFMPHKAVDLNNHRACPELKSKVTRVGPSQVDVKLISTLKSNRLVDKTDHEEDNILKTTPEFRAYVAKQLCSMLDGVLVDRIKDEVWSVPQHKDTQATTGIRLFSDSKTLCRLADAQKETLMQQVQASGSTFKHRKHKLSSSSESSDDEKISACVFSVADIQKENEYLAMTENQVKSPPEPGADIKLTLSQVSNNNALENDSIAVKKKKKNKKKRRKDKNETQINCIA